MNENRQLFFVGGGGPQKEKETEGVSFRGIMIPLRTEGGVRVGRTHPSP